MRPQPATMRRLAANFPLLTLDQFLDRQFVSEYPMNQVFDHSSLAADPDLNELVDIFVQEMPDKIIALETYARSCDWQQLTRAAHQLKGSAGSYGFNALTPCAARLESTLRDGRDEDEILASLNELLDLCRRVRSGVAPTEGNLCRNMESELS